MRTASTRHFTPGKSDNVVLTAEGEAERLWRRAEVAFIHGSSSIAQLCEAVDLGVRVIEIGVVSRLQPIRNQFPRSIATLLEPLPLDVDPLRDFIHPPKSLTYLDVIDMMSRESIPCIAGDLHRQRGERIESCRRARETTRGAVGFSLSEDERRPLILIGACRNRLFALPPPVKIRPEEINRAFASLAVLANRLLNANRVTSDE